MRKHIMRKLTLLIGLIAMIGCAERDSGLEITLNESEGFGVFFPSQSVLSPAREQLSYTGVLENIVEYVVRTISMQPEQDFWMSYKKGDMSAEQFGNLMTHFEIDTLLLTDKAVNHKVKILIGTNDQGKRVIIPDRNNDRDFSNDEVFEYDYPLDIEKQLEVHNALPVIDAEVQLFVENELIDHTVKLVLSPYERTSRITYHTASDTEKKYHLFASMPVHRQGSVKIDNVTYTVHVANDFRGPLYNRSNTRVFISPDSIMPAQILGDIPHSVGEVINLDGVDYKIESVSPLGGHIRLGYLGENQRPSGIAEGYFVPEFIAATLEQEKFRLDDYPDKYILLDFWGTWCNPCIRLIPDLKELNAEFKDASFQLVGVAYDNDAEMVSDFVKENEMDWVHLFVDRNQRDGGSLVDDFQVTSFPTKILINPSGKIVARGRGIDEIRAILQEANS